MTKARELLDEMGVIEFNFDPKKVHEEIYGIDEAPLQSKYPPYRNEFGELSDKADAVLFFDKDGSVYRMKNGKKGKKVDMSKFGRAAREAGKNVRAHDGAKDPE